MSNAVVDCYQTMTNPFGALGPFYDSLGHRGADYRRLARQTVVAYTGMTIDVVDVSSGIGRVVGARLWYGEYAGWAHLVNITVKPGDKVSAGGAFAQVAGANDSPGSLWDGAHIHTTRSRISSYNAAFGIRPLVDPVPGINAAKGAALAGGTGELIEEDNMKYTRFQNDHDFVIRRGKQFFPAVTSPRSENFAAGTGGMGLYELTVDVEIKDLAEDNLVYIQPVLIDAATGKESPGYTQLFEGDAKEAVHANFVTNVSISRAAVLKLRMWSEGTGKEPTLTFLGVDVKNFQY